MARRLSFPYAIFFICGLAAGLAALALSLFLKISVDGLFVPDIASQALVSITSGEIESRAVGTLGSLAKYSAFFGATVVNLVVYGLMGVLIGALLNKISSKRYVSRAVLSSSISYVVILLITLTLIAINAVPGQKMSIPMVSLAILIVPSFVYGFIFSIFFERIRKGKSLPSAGGGGGGDGATQMENLDGDKPPAKATITADVDYKKRALIRAIIVSAIALPLMYLGFNRLLSQSEQQPQRQLSSPSSSASTAPQTPQFKSKSIPPGFEGPKLTPLLDAEVTPTYLFYRIDKNTIVPQVDAKEWSLTVKGLVDNPLVINYDDIKGMESIEQFATLCCISNKIGGDLISTALWKGVRLGDMLSRAKVRPEVKYIVFRCSDGYDVGIPLESGLMEGTVLAYDMNNSPLTADHGYPVRAIVPGFYGMMNPKWITEIELVDKTYEGFWQRKGWSNKKNDNIYSSIVIPGDQQIRNRFPHIVNENFVAGKSSPIAGFAFAGDSGISKIEVSTDGGKTWKSAIVKEPLSKYTWVLWTGGFTPKENNDYKIVVRATDKTGKVQASDVTTPFPNGAAGYNTVGVKT